VGKNKEGTRIKVTNPRSNAFGKEGRIIRSESTWCTAKMDGDKIKTYRLSYSEVVIID
jgi:hypothetical protein